MSRPDFLTEYMKRIVLNYHRIDNLNKDYNNTCVSPENFREQMEYVIRHYEVLKMDDFLQYNGKGEVISVTFDDGFENFISNALPVLEEYNIPATIFVTTKFDTDREFWMSDIMRVLFEGNFKDSSLHLDFFDRTIELQIKSINDRVLAYNLLRRIFRHHSDVISEKVLIELHEQSGIGLSAREEFRPLSKEQVISLSKNSLITIGGHTINHPSLGCLNRKRQKTELEGSIKSLTSIIRKPVEYFAYPFGGEFDYNFITKNILENYGIKYAFTTERRVFEEINDKMAVPRVNCENCSLIEWKRELHGLLSDRKIECKSEIFFTGKKEQDKEIYNADKIVICGCGYNSKKVVEYLNSIGVLDKVIGYADNDKLKANSYVENLKVYKFSDFNNENSVDWIVLNKYDIEIIKQLIVNKSKKIHWWLEE